MIAFRSLAGNFAIFPVHPEVLQYSERARIAEGYLTGGVDLYHGIRVQLREGGEMARPLLGPLALGDVAEDKHDTRWCRAVCVPYGGTAVVDGDLRAVLRDEHRVVRQTHDIPSRSTLVDGIFNRGCRVCSLMIVEDRGHGFAESLA